MRLVELQELAAHLGLGMDQVADVGAIEPADELPGLEELQALQDVGPGGLVGRGCQGYPWNIRETAVQLGQLQVLRAEVVAPLRDAVGLVDGDQRDATIPQHLQESGHHGPFRRDVEQVEFAAKQFPAGPARVLPVLGGVQARGGHAHALKGPDLVLHQGDQWGHNQPGPGSGHRGELVAQGLASPRGHEDQGIPAREHVIHDLLLQPAEAGEAKNPAEKIVDEGQDSTPIQVWTTPPSGTPRRGSLRPSGVLHRAPQRFRPASGRSTPRVARCSSNKPSRSCRAEAGS